MQGLDGKFYPSGRTQEENGEKGNLGDYPQHQKETTMLEVFELQFKNSIRYGMTYNQFWCDNPQLYYTYEEVYLDRLKEKDILNWQLGQYIQIAICASFDDKHRCKYPDKPVFYAREKEKPKTVFDMLAKFNGMVAEVNKNFD